MEHSTNILAISDQVLKASGFITSWNKNIFTIMFSGMNPALRGISIKL